jgi:two-component system, cell cycle response regulator DivK
MTCVLIVEDEPPILSLLDDFFGSEGFDTLLARNGQDGVDMALAQQPDVVLMDILLPRLDGAAATRLLKGDPRTRDIPVVAMSANLSLLERIGDLPADDVVAKPFDLDMLLGIVLCRCGGFDTVLAG